MKKWQKLLGALLMGVTFGASLPVQAGNIPTNCVPLQTYSFRKVYCYLSPGGQQKGWIDAGDFVIVERIQDNGWAYGSYPAGSTRVKRWFRASDLVANINFANQNRYSPKNNTNVYRNSGYNSTIGSFSGNEAITVVSDNGDSRQVIYKLSNGTGYKMGWVPYWDCWSYDQVNPRATVNTQPKGNPIVTPVTRPEATTSSYGAWKATMNKRATAYMDANLTQRNGNEYADKGDTVTVLDESSKGYYVEYPLTRGGTKKRWVVRTAVTALNVSDNNNTNNTNNSTPNAFANGATKAADTIIQNNTQYHQWQGRANCKATAYDNSALTRRLGVEYVSRGDVVTVLGEAGKAYYVEYPLSRGGTKKRWVAKSAIDKVENYSDTYNQNSIVSDNKSPSGYVYPLGKRHTFSYSDSANNYKNHDHVRKNGNKGCCSEGGEGVPVYAINNGTVYYVQIIGDYGNIKQQSVSYGNVAYLIGDDGMSAVYAHLSSFEGCPLKYSSISNKGSTAGKCTNKHYYEIGSKRIVAGEVIGRVGNIGNSSGAHLHFELWRNLKYGQGRKSTAGATRLEPNDYFDK